MMRKLIGILWDEWKTVEQQIGELTDKLEQIAASDAGCCRIRQIPGIGPIVATAIVAAIGNGTAFRKGRDFAAWLGLVPRQYSTGGKARLLGISKRGNIYLRKVLIHGARADADAHQARPLPDWSMDERARSESAAQRAGGRDGEQARTHRLGSALQRRRLPANSERGNEYEIERKRRLRLGSAPRSRFPSLRRRFSPPRSA